MAAPLPRLEKAGPGASGPLVSFEGVRFAYGEQRVLEDVSFDLAEGETLVILGGSGSGKSTILRLLMGFIEAHAGRILFEGEDITHVEERRLVELRQKMGMVFQEGALFDSLTVGENVGYWLMEHGENGRRVPMPEVERRVLAILALVGLEHTIDKMPSELSGGMRRRVAAARTLIYEPDLILYDEPTTGLDPATCENFCKVMNDIKARRGVTGILVTHNLEDALRVGDAFMLLRDGRVLWSGRLPEIKAKGEEFLMGFFRGEAL